MSRHNSRGPGLGPWNFLFGLLMILAALLLINIIFAVWIAGTLANDPGPDWTIIEVTEIRR